MPDWQIDWDAEKRRPQLRHQGQHAYTDGDDVVVECCGKLSRFPIASLQALLREHANHERNAYSMTTDELRQAARDGAMIRWRDSGMVERLEMQGETIFAYPEDPVHPPHAVNPKNERANFYCKRVVSPEPEVPVIRDPAWKRLKVG